MIENYIAHLNGFKHRRRAHPLTVAELALYFVMLEYCNDLGWMEWFCAPAGVLYNLCGMSESAFFRARRGLVQKGYLLHQRERGNLAPTYSLPDFSHCRAGVPSGVQAGVQTTVQEKAPQTRGAGGSAKKVTGSATDSATGSATGNATALTKEKQKEKHALTGIEAWGEWRDYVAMRQTIKRPLTNRAKAMALERLQGLAPGDEAHQRRILDQSVFHSWQGLFPLREAEASAGKAAAAGGGNPFAGLVP